MKIDTLLIRYLGFFSISALTPFSSAHLHTDYLAGEKKAAPKCCSHSHKAQPKAAPKEEAKAKPAKKKKAPAVAKPPQVEEPKKPAAAPTPPPAPPVVKKKEQPAAKVEPVKEAVKAKPAVEAAPLNFVPQAADGKDAPPALSEKVKAFATKLSSIDATDEKALEDVYKKLAADGGSGFLYRIPFATGETGVPKAHQEALISKLKAANPKATLVTIGYADTRGDEAENKKLSYGRAREVAGWIKSTLGGNSKLETFSMGETDRFSKDDFAKNRVVEVWEISAE